MDWVVTDSIGKESWRRLQEFANVELTIDFLARRNGDASTSHLTRNYKKQAEQARVCVLQAREYFDAAAAASLYTSPNHLYYGLVALSSMQLLLLGDGTTSLDFRRKDPRNSHHGLRFTTGCTAATAGVGLSLLENSRAEVLPDGHFLSWYSRLPLTVDLYGLHRAQVAEGEYKDFRPAGQYAVAAPGALVGRKRSALELLSLFPDLCQELSRYGAPVDAARTTQEVRITPDGNTFLVWAFHQQLMPDSGLLDRFQVRPRFSECIFPRHSESGRMWAIEVFVPRVEGFNLRAPESRDTMDHETISFAAQIDTHELVDAYVVAYQLSMLSRYFPDLWVACIESHCKAAKLIERTVDVLIKKTPILALSLLSEGGTTISTHRAPWK